MQVTNLTVMFTKVLYWFSTFGQLLKQFQPKLNGIQSNFVRLYKQPQSTFSQCYWTFKSTQRQQANVPRTAICHTKSTQKRTGFCLLCANTKRHINNGGHNVSSRICGFKWKEVFLWSFHRKLGIWWQKTITFMIIAPDLNICVVFQRGLWSHWPLIHWLTLFSPVFNDCLLCSLQEGLQLAQPRH